MSFNRGWTYHDRIRLDGAGLSVSAFYASRYRHSSAAEWAARAESGEILLNGRRAAPGDILAAGDDRAIYSIEHTHLGYEVRRRTPGQRCHEYVSCFRKGEYTWHSDSLYAKHYSFDTAVKHVLELYRKDNA